MPIDGFDTWRAELMATGVIVQDGDDSVPWPERERRFNRYVQLTEAVTGGEGVEAAVTLIQSLQSRHDYGAYQSTQHALGRFPPDVYVGALLQELPALIQRQEEWAGELVCGLANGVGTRFESDIAEFRRRLLLLSAPAQEAIVTFLRHEEEDGWLRHRRGVLS